MPSKVPDWPKRQKHMVSGETFCLKSQYTVLPMYNKPLYPMYDCWSFYQNIASFLCFWIVSFLLTKQPLTSIHFCQKRKKKLADTWNLVEIGNEHHHYLYFYLTVQSPGATTPCNNNIALTLKTGDTMLTVIDGFQASFKVCASWFPCCSKSKGNQWIPGRETVILM